MKQIPCDESIFGGRHLTLLLIDYSLHLRPRLIRLQPATWNLELATCNLEPATCNLNNHFTATIADKVVRHYI